MAEMLPPEADPQADPGPDPTPDPAPDLAPPATQELGRAWIGPALLLAGAATLVRVEMLTEMATHSRGVPTEWAAWSVLGDWPAEVIQAGILAGASTVVIWGVRGIRRVIGTVVALALMMAAITGWPLDHQAYGSPFDAYTPFKLGILVAAFVFWIPLLAAANRRVRGLDRLLSRSVVLGLCAVIGLGGPGYSLWQRSLNAPQMNVQRVLTTPGEAGTLWIESGETVEWVVPAGDDRPLSLRLRAQVSAGPMGETPAQFQVSVDGTPVHTESLHDIDVGARRGPVVELDVEAGQTITFAANFTSAAGSEMIPLRAGFSELRLHDNRRMSRTRTAHGQPSLLFITVDSLRSDRLSCYGYERYTTPSIDQLAQRGTLFERAFSSSSWTWPSTASLFTGLAPHEHGLLREEDAALDPWLETLAETLQANGFSTAAVSSSPRITPGALFDQGFETFDASPWRRSSEEVLGAVRTKLMQLARTRFFLYVHLSDPEVPRRPLESELERMGLVLPTAEEEERPEEPVVAREDPTTDYIEQLYAGAGRDADGDAHPERLISSEDRLWLQDQYDASVGSADHYVGMILHQLERLELLDSTLVVLTSDHGEELLDHGLLSHGHSINRELVQVPLILAGPGIAMGRRVEVEVSNRHVAPTLAKLLGIEFAGATDARNLLEPGLDSSGVFYQTSRGRWLGQTGLELRGSRRDGFVVQSAAALPDWGMPSGEGQALRIFYSEQDAGEWSDLSAATEYFERAVKRQAEIEQRTADERARRTERADGGTQ